MKYLCLDLGTAHTGLAISEEGMLASPLDTIFETKIDKLIGKLVPYIAKQNPDIIIIGIPEHGPMVQYVEKLKSKLQDIFSGETILYSEDNTSQVARNININIHKTLAKRIDAEHQTAAAVILQNYLDSL